MLPCVHRPGPTSPLAWVQRCIESFSPEKLREKLLVGIPFYGYDFFPGDTRPITGSGYLCSPHSTSRGWAKIGCPCNHVTVTSDWKHGTLRIWVNIFKNYRKLGKVFNSFLALVQKICGNHWSISMLRNSLNPLCKFLQSLLVFTKISDKSRTSLLRDIVESTKSAEFFDFSLIFPYFLLLDFLFWETVLLGKSPCPYPV